MALPRRVVPRCEPNHRQEIALQRIEFAVSELASVMISCGPTHEVLRSAIAGVRNAVAPVLARILAEE
jgi:hypothetical protein